MVRFSVAEIGLRDPEDIVRSDRFDFGDEGVGAGIVADELHLTEPEGLIGDTFARIDVLRFHLLDRARKFIGWHRFGGQSSQFGVKGGFNRFRGSSWKGGNADHQR